MTASGGHTPWLPPLSFNAWLRYDVVQQLVPEGVRDVLEIGCGRGGFAARLAERYRYVGLEPDRRSYESARQHLISRGRGEVRNGDLSCVGADERFDLVCAFEVIEHIQDDRRTLAEWTAHLRPGGWLLLSAPAWQRRFAAADVAAGHFRRYDPPVLRDLLHGAGLREVQTVLYGGPPGFLLETGRNLMARWLVRPKTGASMAERTGASGRWLQPGNATGTVIRLASVPLRHLQRRFPDTGPGVIARGRLVLG
jgi:SAM-dependent methyltransferase